MTVENPLAFSFILQDDLYLLAQDKIAVITQPPAVADVLETPSLNFNYLGEYKKNFLIMVHYQEHDFMEDSHLNALQSTLTRLTYGLDDVAILNLAKYPDSNFGQLKTFFAPKKMLIMGAKALPAEMDPLQLNIIVSQNECNTLFTYSFDEMMASNENKKAFWEQMKQL